MRRVAVIGVGVTKFGKHDRTSAELFAEAAAEAITDAQIAPTAVQALYFGNVTGGETERQLHMAPLAATLLGLPSIPTTRFENACATSHVAFRHAVMEIASGVSDVILVGGAERVLNVPTESATEFFAYCSDASLEQPAGLTFPGVFARRPIVTPALRPTRSTMSSCPGQSRRWLPNWICGTRWSRTTASVAVTGSDLPARIRTGTPAQRQFSISKRAATNVSVSEPGATPSTSR